MKYDIKIRDFLLIFFVILIIGFIINRTFIFTYEDFNAKRVARSMMRDIFNPIKRGLEKGIDESRRAAEKAGREVKKLDSHINKLKHAVERKLNELVRFLNKIKNDVANQFKYLAKKMQEFLEKIARKIEDMVKLIAKKIVEFTEKLGKMFVALGHMINDAIVQPILHFFAGFGKIFMEIFGILMQIINKIISLPKCLPSYLISGIYGYLKQLYRYIVPGFIRGFISLLYQYIFVPFMKLCYYVMIYPVEFIMNLFGLSLVQPFYDWFRKNKKLCYDFNVDKQVKNMGRTFQKMGREFVQNFGRMDFSKLNTFR